MKKNRLFPLAGSLLLVSGLLSACNGGTKPEQSISSETVSSSAEGEVIDGDIVFGEIPSNIDISLGEANAFDLLSVATVTGNPSYSVEVVTPGTVKMIGTKIVGTDYGAFEVIVHDGGNDYRFAGHVVTKKKLEFNALISTIEDNFTSYSSFHGLEMFAKDYWVQSTGSDSTLGIATFRGGITHPTTKLPYAFTMSLMVNASTGAVTYSPLTIDKGFGRSKADMGFGAFGLTGDSFTEQIDASGKPTGYYLLKDEYDENGASTIVEPLIERIGGDFYSMLGYYISSDTFDLAAQVTEGGITLYPVNKKGSIIVNFTTENGTFSTGIEISAIGESGLSSCENWLLNPELPEQVHTNDLSAYFANLVEKKTYSMSTYGRWFNPETNSTGTCPSNMVFSSGGEMFGNFTTTVHANENVVEGIVETADSAISIPSNSDKAPKAGDVDLRFFSDGDYLYLKGTKKADDSVSWNAPTPLVADGMKSVWETTAVPTMFAPTDKFNLFSLCSFYDYQEDETAGKVFSYNPNGQDMLLGQDSPYYKGVPYFAMSLIDHMLGLQNSAYLTVIGYLYDFTKMNFTLSPDGKDMSFRMLFNYSSTLSYETGWKISGVGEDNVSEASKTLYAKIAAL